MIANRAQLQERLFELMPKYSADSAGAARVAFGSAAEEIVCSALGLDRIKINGQFECNFDAEKDGIFYEIKSVRRNSGKIVAYECRMEKDSLFDELFYAILTHDISGVSSDILTRMFATCEILLCPAKLIRDLRLNYPIHIPKIKPERGPRFGYTRAGYVDGYRNIPVSALIHSKEKNKCGCMFSLGFTAWRGKSRLRSYDLEPILLAEEYEATANAPEARTYKG